MNKFKKFLIKLLIPERELFKIAGHLAERFVEKFDDNMNHTGDYDDLRAKMFYWLKCHIYKYWE